MNITALPKIELHCHLDGSMRPSTCIDLAKQYNVKLASYDLAEVTKLMSVDKSCANLVEYIKSFALPLSLMQTEEALERVTFELLEDAAAENVKYIEVRFGPQLHREQNLSYDLIIGAVLKGIQKAERMYDIHGNIIFSFIKTMVNDDIYEILQAGANYLHQGVCAVDLAGAENPGFAENYQDYINYAIRLGYHVTMHAGEQGNSQNIEDAILLLNAERIGHGVFLYDNPRIYKLVQDLHILLEMCPSSNLDTNAVDVIKNHPFMRYYNDGIDLNISTDNRTVSSTNLTHEITCLMNELNLTLEQYKDIYRASVLHAFTSNSIKAKLLTYVDEI